MRGRNDGCILYISKISDACVFYVHVPSQTTLVSPPSDGISSLAWANVGTSLLVASWDSVCRAFSLFFLFFSLLNCLAAISQTFQVINKLFHFNFDFQSVRLYNASANQLKTQFRHNSPVLCCCFASTSSDTCFSGGVSTCVPGDHKCVNLRA